MTHYTAQEVEHALEEVVRYGGWEELDYSINGRIDAPKGIKLQGELVPVEVIAQEGEGEYGYETYVVLQVGTQLFRKDGYYQSHYGNDWDGHFREVQAREKTVLVYE